MKIQTVRRTKRSKYRAQKIKKAILKTGYSGFEALIRAMSYISLAALMFFGCGLDDQYLWEGCLVGLIVSGLIFVVTGFIRLEIFEEE